jgi:hypothetical protein
MRHLNGRIGGRRELGTNIAAARLKAKIPVNNP